MFWTRPATGSFANLHARSDVGSPTFRSWFVQSNVLVSCTCCVVAGLTGSADSATDGRNAYIANTATTTYMIERGTCRGGSIASSAMFEIVSMPV